MPKSKYQDIYKNLKQKIEKEYHAYIELRKKLESLNLNQEQRLREMDFCRFEIDDDEMRI